MRGYTLAKPAQEDLVAIRDYHLKEAGYRIARQMVAEFVEAFHLIARNPGIGHKREDLAGARPLLFCSMREFLIVYRAAKRPVEIVAIARGGRDVARIIRRRKLLN